ncbi:hypothetical protein SAMN05216559_3930 [Halomicrobium zhouii]|uniref:Uncharacterized protein n=1 Tax=Halomicrobium zhouii TaxID=767519 RepID=A0A1I6M7Q9_9EURY|nr:hypothetical protein SAMN05216559_3930 [Halomicrobium zhouii]
MTEYVCQNCGRESERSPLCVTCPSCGGPLESAVARQNDESSRRLE